MPLFAILMFQVASQPTSAPARPQHATEFSVAERICEIADPEINEASGLCASRANPGVYYTHNDSGGKPVVYAFDREGRIRARIELIDAKNVDWEDIAIAPGPAPNTSGPAPNTWDVCVADIGDNKSERCGLTLYRFPDAALPVAALTTAPRERPPVDVRVRPTSYEIRYEDGPCDAEGFLVHPQTGDGYVIQKRAKGPAAIYHLPGPWKTESPQVLKRVGELKFPNAPPIQTLVTAADFSPDGRALVARSYACGWFWKWPGIVNDAGDVLKLMCETPERLDLASEPQGEAICFSIDGRCILTISEKTPTWLNEICAAAP